MAAMLVLFLAAIWAGVQNALAGGGSFITLPSLMLTGMDARAANITSTVALFPAQLVTGFTGRADAGEPDRAHDAKAVRHQPHRRRPWRADPPRDAAVDLRPPRAVAGAVRDRALRLGQLFSQSPGARRSASVASRARAWRSFSSPSMAAISAAASVS